MIIDLAAFARDGYVVVDDHFNAAELDDFDHEYKRLYDALYSRGRVGSDIYDAAFMLPSFLRIAAKRETADVCNALMGRDQGAPLYLSANRVLMQAPNDDRHCYGWHQETYYSIPGSRFCQTWFPLIVDSTDDNGTIIVAIGSHRDGVQPCEWTEEPGHSAQIIVHPEIVQRYELRSIPMRLGQCMFFDSRLIHRSGKNTGNAVRFSGVGLYHDVDAPGFRAPGQRFEWRGKSPRQAWEETR